jgi:hypothetical protein
MWAKMTYPAPRCGDIISKRKLVLSSIQLTLLGGTAVCQISNFGIPNSSVSVPEDVSCKLVLCITQTCSLGPSQDERVARGGVLLTALSRVAFHISASPDRVLATTTEVDSVVCRFFQVCGGRPCSASHVNCVHRECTGTACVLRAMNEMYKQE